YESYIGTPNGQQNSKQYNKNVRKHTVKLAMIDQIERAKRGDSEFSEVILAHFALKKEDCITVVEAWAADTGIENSDKQRLKTLLDTLH
ncbi:MAG: hypothetical protein EZS28_040879, partial [Streblomastix strix]